MRHGGLTDEQWEFVFELYCFGYNYNDLSEWLGYTGANIRHHFHRLGLRANRNDLEPLSIYTRKLFMLGVDSDVRP